MCGCSEILITIQRNCLCDGSFSNLDQLTQIYKRDKFSPPPTGHTLIIQSVSVRRFLYVAQKSDTKSGRRRILLLTLSVEDFCCKADGTTVVVLIELKIYGLVSCLKKRDGGGVKTESNMMVFIQETHSVQLLCVARFLNEQKLYFIPTQSQRKKTKKLSVRLNLN